jgi:tetratricopeptide (TPR) repeat protein
LSGHADPHEEHKAIRVLAQARAARGDRTGAVAALSRLEQILPDDPTAAVERQKLRGFVAFFSRDFREAAVAFEKTVDMARSVGLGYEVAANLHHLGDSLLRLGDLARSYGAFSQSLAYTDEFGFERLGNLNRMYLAYLDAVAGKRGAEGLLLQGLRYAEANEFTWDVVGGRSLLAQLYRRNGDLERARAEYEELGNVARAAGNSLGVYDATQALTEIGPGA